MNLYQWLCLLGIPTIIGILISIIIKNPIEKKIAEQAAEQETQRTQSAAIMLGVQALLRDRLLQAFKHYEEQGWASYEDKKNVENMHIQYEALGENNVMNNRYDRFLALPDTEPKEHKKEEASA